MVVFLVNYDIYWNPVKIIQRFGRIDRLGSKNSCIQLVNFFNKETNNCKDMSYYTYLLEEAVKNVIGKEEEKGIESLFSRCGTTLDIDKFKGLEDFE